MSQPSLRGRLLVTLLAVVAPIVVALAAVLFFAVQRSVWAGLDGELLELGDTVVDLVEYDHEDGYEFELGAHPRPLTRGAGQATYLELQGPRGEALSRSEGLDAVELPPPGEEALTDAVLSDGRRVRVLTRRFVPRVDDEAPPELAPPSQVTLVLARETASTRTMLARLATWFVGLGLVTLGLASFAAWWAVRRGLEPLVRVSGTLEAIEASDRGLSQRLDSQALPAELRPLISRMNAVLDRLERAFARERQLTGDVAHELRTPLSVLRTELELSLRRERTPVEYRESQAAALDTVIGLGTLVDNLLLLARLDHGVASSDSNAPIELRGLIDQCWSPHADTAASRGLSYACSVDGQVEVDSDAGQLRMVISNLLANAAQYTEPGGWIRVESRLEVGVVVAVVDSGPTIPLAEREQLFERFWRGDLARGEAGGHCGIGLSLARSLCETLGFDLRVEERADGAIAFVVTTDAPANV